jgi:hypothetical protein
MLASGERSTRDGEVGYGDESEAISAIGAGTVDDIHQCWLGASRWTGS